MNTLRRREKPNRTLEIAAWLWFVVCLISYLAEQYLRGFLLNGDCFFNCPQSSKPPLIVIILIMSPVGVLTIPVFFHIKFGVLPFEALRGRLSVLGLGEPLELGYNQRGAIRIIKRAVWFLFIIFMVWELNRPFYYHADVLSVIRYVYLPPCCTDRSFGGEGWTV